MVDVRRMYSEYFNIRVVRWETFFSWLMGGDITHPETGPCRGADLVLGGIDYTTEYMYVMPHFSHTVISMTGISIEATPSTVLRERIINDSMKGWTYSPPI